MTPNYLQGTGQKCRIYIKMNVGDISSIEYESLISVSLELVVDDCNFNLM